MPMNDAGYEALMNAHRGLSDEQSRRLDVALVLLLLNQADSHVLRESLQAARAAVLTKEGA